MWKRLAFFLKNGSLLEKSGGGGSITYMLVPGGLDDIGGVVRYPAAFNDV